MVTKKSVMIARFFYLPRGIILYPKQLYQFGLNIDIACPLCLVFRF